MLWLPAQRHLKLDHELFHRGEPLTETTGGKRFWAFDEAPRRTEPVLSAKVRLAVFE